MAFTELLSRTLSCTFRSLIAKPPWNGLGSAYMRPFSTSHPLEMVQKLTRMRVVDNSAIGQQAMAAGKPPKVIHVYRRQIRRKRRATGTIGHKVLVAIMGQKKRGYVVGVAREQEDQIPRFDTNNLVLVDDNGSPLGTRITVPIPMLLRSKTGDISKILAIATKFV
ncbi:39S ribosomal protein L14, mitochondrial-like [Paramacrobiotus metropolitanus]|uniref:39S ribosomal protein L14, mitochondrial-like n=1 Tax=Paramacrobiotus metropolitanus TaxID=2943436 RepID=UPI002445E3B5|nr:39S ribosomal protein L14, mitochondrial-like [Paramacrobiotus metropolitanus]